VRECIHKASQRQFAVKIIEKETLGTSNMTDIATEIDILRQVGDHPHIVSLVDYFEDDHEMYLVMD